MRGTRALWEQASHNGRRPPPGASAGGAGRDGPDVVAGRGQVIALLGPNCAEEAAFVRAPATLLCLGQAELRAVGHDARCEPSAVQKMAGLVGQLVGAPPTLSRMEPAERESRGDRVRPVASEVVEEYLEE